MFWAAVPRSSRPRHQLWLFQVSSVLLLTGFQRYPLTSLMREERGWHAGCWAHRAICSGSLVQWHFPATTRTPFCSSGMSSRPAGDGAGRSQPEAEVCHCLYTALSPRTRCLLAWPQCPAAGEATQLVYRVWVALFQPQDSGQGGEALVRRPLARPPDF